MRKLLISSILLVAALLSSIDIIFIDSIDLNQPEIYDEIKLFEDTAIDSLKNQSLKIFSGSITDNGKSLSDSLQVEIISRMDADWVIPDDFKFTLENEKILASNIGEGNTKKHIYEIDGKKIGIFSLYSPDYPVRNFLPDSTQFGYNLDDILKDYILELSAETDYILLCTGIPKKIIKNLIKGLPIDFIYSTDYKKYTDETLNDHTYFMTVKSDQIGVLKIAADSTRTYEYKEYGRSK